MRLAISHRRPRCEPLLPADLAPLRARLDHHHQFGPRRVRRDLRRPLIAGAILDRQLHYSILVNIKGEGFRLNQKLKAGLPKPKLDTRPAL